MKSSPWVCLCGHYDYGAGGGNYHEIVGFHNPKNVTADYRDFDEDPHNRNQNQRDGYDNQRLETVLDQAVNGEPNKISADHESSIRLSSSTGKMRSSLAPTAA